MTAVPGTSESPRGVYGQPQPWKAWSTHSSPFLIRTAPKGRARLHTHTSTWFKSHPESREAFWNKTPQEIRTGFVLLSARHKPDVLHSKWLSSFCFCWMGSFITSCQPGERDTGKERSMWQKWKCEKTTENPLQRLRFEQGWGEKNRMRGERKHLGAPQVEKGFTRQTKRNWR